MTKSPQGDRDGIARMTVTKLDAAKSQLATAIRLYFEDCGPVSVHTLVMAASEIIDRLCQSKGAPTIRNDLLLAPVLPERRRKEIADALDKARNFFKHASSSKPNQVLRDFSDEQNLIGIIMAANGLGLLGVEMPETRAFRAWVWVAEPELMLAPRPPRNCSPPPLSKTSITSLGRYKKKLDAPFCSSCAWALPTVRRHPERTASPEPEEQPRCPLTQTIELGA